MKFVFLFLGRTRKKYLDAGIRDYAKRLARFVPVQIIVLKERRPGSAPDEKILRADADLLLGRCGRNSFRVVLDSGGEQMDSVELADRIRRWQGQGMGRVDFLIGGHLGLHTDLVRQADFVWSLSRLTFPHELSRLIALEQLYRACTINAGHRYHK